MTSGLPRIAYVFPGGADHLGGAETQALGFLRHFDRTRLEVAFVLLGPHVPFEHAVRSLGDVAVHQLNASGRSLWSPAVIASYARLLGSERFALVHLYGLRHEIWSRCVSRRGGARVVSAIRGMESHRGSVTRHLNHLTAPCVDIWISNSVTVRDLFARRDRLPVERILVVPNGVESEENEQPASARAAARRALGVEPGAWCVGCVANHHPAKRLGDLVTALAGLIAQGVPADLLLIGRTTDHTPKIVARAKALGVESRLHVLGFRADARTLLPLLDCVVLASEKEGLPSSLLEAMAEGIPVVATNAGGVAELIVDGKSGLIVRVGCPDELTAAMMRLARAPDAARAMGAQGRARARELFGVERLARRLESIYLELIAAGRGSRGGTG